MKHGHAIMRRIFRQQALDSASSPEQLDHLMRVVRPQHWLALCTCIMIALLACLWAFWGEVPITVAGRGVLIRPRKVVSIQAPATGRLTTLKIQVGDRVKVGDVLGLIDQTELQQQLHDTQLKLQTLLTQDETQQILQQQQIELQRKQSDLELHAIELQKEDIYTRLHDAQQKEPILKKRLKNYKRLETIGILPKSSNEYLESERDYQSNQNNISEFKTKLKQLEGNIKQLNIDNKKVIIKDIETSNSRKNQIQELRNNIHLLEIQLGQSGRIISQHEGRILELTVYVGQVIESRHRLGSIDVEDIDSQMVGMTYFPIEAGKKIAPGMRINIAPDMVERSRFGSMLGHVKSVSTFPATQEGVASLVGNQDVVNALLTRGPVIEVVAELEPNRSTFSGYQWSSSKGPDLPITPSTTMTGRVTIERRAPITYVIPILREASGFY